MDSRTCLRCGSGREETLAHFPVDCDALANTREVTTLIPTHSTLDVNVTPGNVPANTVAGIFRRIREEQLSSGEMSQVLIGGTVVKEEGEGTATVLTWETLVPPEASPVGACLFWLELCDRQNTAPSGRACHCESGPRRITKKKPKKELEGVWPSQRPCGKTPLTVYRQALPRGREEKKENHFLLAHAQENPQNMAEPTPVW